MRTPGRAHLKALLHLLRCLRDIADLGIIFYRKQEDFPIYDLLKESGEMDAYSIFGIHDPGRVVQTPVEVQGHSFYSTKAVL